MSLGLISLSVVNLVTPPAGQRSFVSERRQDPRSRRLGAYTSDLLALLGNSARAYSGIESAVPASLRDHVIAFHDSTVPGTLPRAGNARRRGEWRTLALLLPYLWEFRGRVAIAVACLVTAKLANVGVPLV